MRRLGLVVLLASVVLGYGNPVLAREGGAGHHDKMGRDGNEGRGGAALDHRSQKASENSNAKWSSGATKGQDRAELRRQNGHGRGHGKNHDEGEARGHGKEHGGKARGHGKDHGGKAHGHDKRK
ncbi:hypothetical protein SAMN05216420_10913 [Nitrosospira sp. Nl5]|uniref:hypothetical protein n=1 Tax=Nitrosospira sp. Nl5 TaxID=200120 RepID=UPI00087EA6EB|nr:hypothetical protein [Nitrosospira sp. Nl5]SCY57072.1 hypothetical protein SAMN05216420_10913 [Nitrosospira sp. Nl5]